MSGIWRPPEAHWTPERERKAGAVLALLAKVAHAHPTAALATSLQAEDAVLCDMIARTELSIDLIMLDTGRLPAETLDAKTAIEDRYGRSITVIQPDKAEIAAWIGKNGTDGFYDSERLRHECCALRKVRPLARALAGRTAWITGQRRDQAASRLGLEEHEIDAVHGIEKFNPLACWRLEDVWAYVRNRDVPVNALYARGYASIGCDPCTRVIRQGENTRAGRWWWEASTDKECGLHVQAEAPALGA